MIYPVILAGGTGTRLWPVSTRHRPKQIKSLIGDKTLLQTTYQRLLAGFDKENIQVVTDEKILPIVKKQIDIKKQNVLLEPFGQGTAIALGLAAIKLYTQDKEAIIVNINSDAYVKEVDDYIRIIKQAADKAGKTDQMVLIGIKPRYPETGYGYMELGDIDKASGLYKVLSFREKPALPMAEQFVEAGNYLWNPTLLVFSAKKLLDWYKEFLPDIYQALMNIQKADFDAKITAEEYSKVKKICINIGLLEKLSNMLAIQADFTWADIGHWRSLRDVLLLDKDSDNISNTKIVTLDSHKNLLYSFSDKLIATIGVEDMIMVETKEAIFMCPADRAQDLKLLLKQIESDEELKKYL